MGGRANNYLNNLWSYPRTSFFTLYKHIFHVKKAIRIVNCSKKGEKFLLLSSHACCCLKCAFSKLTETRQQLIGSVGTSMKFKPQENSSRTMPCTYTISSFFSSFFGRIYFFLQKHVLQSFCLSS